MLPRLRLPQFPQLLSAILLLTAAPAHAVLVSASGTPTNLSPSTPAVSVTYVSSSLAPTMNVVSGGICTNVAVSMRGGGVFTNPGPVCSGPLIGTAAASSITTSPQTNAEALGPGNVDTAAASVRHGAPAWFIRNLNDGAINQTVVIPVRVYRSVAVGISAFADSVTVDASASTNLNVKSNDLVDTRPADEFNSVAALTGVAGLSGLSLDAGTGVLNIPSGQPAGTFNVTYSLCQAVTQSSNCQTGTVTITVTSNISAVADSASLTTSGGSIDILSNDTANGSPATTSNVTVSLIGNGGLSTASISNGRLVIASGVAVGNYTLTYSICLQSSPAVCSSAAVALAITAIPVSAAADAASLTSGGGSIDILANDRVGGQPATVSNAEVTLVANGGITAATVDAQGLLQIPSGLAAGNYSLQYRLCQRGTSNCASAAVTVTISQSSAQLLARDDRATVPVTGGSFSVISNDTFNGRAMSASEVTLTLTANGGIAGLSLNAAGVLSVPATSETTTYVAAYSLCQRALPANCVSARIYITVVVGIVDVVTNKPPSVPGGPRTTTVTIAGPGGTPIAFNTSSTGTSAGAVNDPLTFAAVKLVFGQDENGPVQAFYRQSDVFSPYGAQLYYSGSGVLRARWEVVFPGDPLPTELDLFPEASLPPPLRATQQRYLLQDRVQVYLPPTGRLFIRGPDPARLPRNLPGEYLILLRIEASPGAAGLEGGRAPFPIPVLSYRLQESAIRDPLRSAPPTVNQFSSLGQLGTGGVRLASTTYAPAPVGEGFASLALSAIPALLPQEGASITRDRTVTFNWADVASVSLYRIEVQSATGTELFSALAKPGMGSYAMPPPIRETLPIGQWVRWRVTGRTDGKVIAASEWRGLRLE